MSPRPRVIAGWPGGVLVRVLAGSALLGGALLGPASCAGAEQPASGATVTDPGVRPSVSASPSRAAQAPLTGAAATSAELAARQAIAVPVRVSSGSTSAAGLDAADAVLETLPHRAKYLRLNHRLARKIVDAHREWLDEVERELGSGRARRSRAGRRPGRG